MKLLLHIGCPKTCTTSIQQSLNLNRGKLAEDGFFFGTSLGLVNHHLARLVLFPESEALLTQFSSAARAGRIEPQKLRAKLTEDFIRETHEARNNGCHTAIISDELIYTGQPSVEMLEHTSGFLGQHFDKIEIVWVVRPQPDMYVSRLSTRARSGMAISPRDVKDHPRDFFEFDRFAAKLERVFPGRITVIPFKRHNNIVDAFASTLGIFSLTERPERQNEAVDVRMMALLVALKNHLKPADYREFMLRHVDRFACRIPLSIGLDNARSITEVYLDSNRRFVTQYACAADMTIEDLLPDFARYDKPANLELLEMSFKDALTYLVAELDDDPAHREELETLGVFEKLTQADPMVKE